MARSLEDALEQFLGTDPAHFLSFSRGSSALFALLKALGIGAGDEVVVTGYTCVVVANAVKFLGADCVYADIDAKTYGTDPSKVAQAITGRTRAVIAQHTFGLPADIQAIRDVADRNDLFLIEDCALSIGSRIDGEVVGSIGDAAFWSGSWTKPIPCGKGGFLAVKDAALVDEIERLRQSLDGPSTWRDLYVAGQIPVRRYVLTSRTKMFAKAIHRRLARHGLIGGSPHGKNPPPECLGIQDDAFLGKCGRSMEAMWKWQLRRYDRDIAHSRELADFYADILPELGLEPAATPSRDDIVFSRYPVRVGNKKHLLRLGESEFVAIGDWMTEPLHQAVAPRERWDYVAGSCPVGERAGREVINLPTDIGASLAEANRVVDFLRRHADRPQEVK